MARSLATLAASRFARLDPAARRDLERAVVTAERRAALFHRYRPGGSPAPHPIALTPLLVSRRTLPGLHRLADCVHRFQALAPGLFRDDVAGFRALCPVAHEVQQWLARLPAAPAPWQLMIRPDVGLVTRPSGPPIPVLFETNATGLAGLYNHAAAVRILREEVFPRLLTPGERRSLADPPDLLALCVRWVTRAARRLGRRRLRGVAFLETRGPLDGYSEVPRLLRAFQAAGIPAAHGAPDELRLVRGTAYLRDRAVDVVYRDFGLDELGPPPARPGRLGGLWDRLAAGAVLPGPAGEFSHKGLLECLTRPEFGRCFTSAERRWLRLVVPWTRVLAARRTEGLHGRPVDLAEHARRRRTALVIKPNVGSSGEGILLGRETTPARWEAAIARGVRDPGAWVVQARRSGVRPPMVYLRAGRAHRGRAYLSLGLFYAPGDLGLHVRVSREPIVNVARQGAVGAAFLGR